MPQWIHDRADHLRKKNPEMSESQSFAIATQQSYAAGKAPKDYGTSKGRSEAKKKYDDPKNTYEKQADPSHKSKTASRLAFWKGFEDELVKIAMAPIPMVVPKPPTALADVKKVVDRQKSSLVLRKPNYSRPHKPQSPAVGPLATPDGATNSF